VREIAESNEGFDAAYMRQAAELGWFAMLVDESHGGGSISGQGIMDTALVAVERGRYLQPGAFVPVNVVAWALSRGGTQDQRTTVLPAVLTGESVATWAAADLSGSWEPGAGVRLEPDGTGYRLSGAKGFVQDAHVADWLLVNATSSAGLTQVLLPADARGIEVVPLDGLDLTRRLCTVRFNSVEVGTTDIVGVVDQAAEEIDRELQLAIVLALAESIGSMERNLQIALDYAQIRTAFGRPIGSFQAIKHLLADTSLLLETSIAMATAAASAAQSETEDSAEIVSMAKAFVSDSAVDLTQNCLQVFGGIGFTWEHDQHLYLRRLAADANLFGESSWHREHIFQLHGL
jgi:alkylation response protein AidB-like acyl-CoA dehydrogenase